MMPTFKNNATHDPWWRRIHCVTRVDDDVCGFSILFAPGGVSVLLWRWEVSILVLE